MKFAVTYRYDFTRIQSDTNDFYYCERESDPILFLDAPNREAAARKFLSKDYDELLKRGDEFEIEAYFDDVMKEFIVCCSYGDSLLEKYEKQKEIDKLTDDIYDYYTEKMMEAGKVKIMIENGETSLREDSDNGDCIKIVHDKFSASRLLELLTDNEKKEVYIETNLRNVMVIRLEKM